MSCSNCYKLIVGGVESIYTLEKRTTGNAWFVNGERITDSGIITSLFSLIDTPAKQASAEVLCVSQEITVVLSPYGETFTDSNAVVSVPATARSLTIMVEPSSNSRVEVSFDGGTSWTLELRKREVKSWSEDNTLIDFSNVRIRAKGGATNTATFDIHGEQE